MPRSCQVEAWHTVTVTHVPIDGDDDPDYEVVHPDSCEVVQDEDCGPGYLCGLQNSIDFEGFSSLGITEAGTYRAQHIYWPGDGWEIEHDAEVRTERVREVSDVAA